MLGYASLCLVLLAHGVLGLTPDAGPPCGSRPVGGQWLWPGPWAEVGNNVRDQASAVEGRPQGLLPWGTEELGDSRHFLLPVAP